MQVVIQHKHTVPVPVIGRRQQQFLFVVYCLQAVSHGVEVGPLYFVRAIFPDLADQVAVCVIGIGNRGGLFPIEILFC